jgi:uncharacterized protein YukE
MTEVTPAVLTAKGLEIDNHSSNMLGFIRSLKSTVDEHIRSGRTWKGQAAVQASLLSEKLEKAGHDIGEVTEWYANTLKAAGASYTESDDALQRSFGVNVD